MTIRRSAVLGAAVLAAAVLGLSGCANPKVLVSHSFTGTDKTAKLMIQESGVDPSTNRALFHFWARICDMDAAAKETGCKDTLVLQDVRPESIF